MSPTTDPTTSARTAEARSHSETDIHAACCPARIHRPPTPPSPFRLLDLPAELQTCIASHVLLASSSSHGPSTQRQRHSPTIRIRLPRFNRHPSPPRRLKLRPRLDRPVPPSPPSSRSPSASARDRDIERGVGHSRLALLLTCRALYHDHWRTYYGRNTFEFADVETFEAFVAGISDRCAAEIRAVRFRMPHKYGHERIWKGLAGLKGLERVELVLHAARKAERAEWDVALRGATLCRALREVSIRRRREDEEEKRVEEDGERGRGGNRLNRRRGQQQQGEDDGEARDGEDEGEEALAKDREVEDKINRYLRQRGAKKRDSEATA